MAASVDLKAGAGEKFHGHLLVDRVVLDQQDGGADELLRQRRTVVAVVDGPLERGVLPTEDLNDGVEHHRGVDRLDQKTLQPGGLGLLHDLLTAVGGHQDDRGDHFQARVPLDPAGGVDPVHARHLPVHDDDVVGRSPAARSISASPSAPDAAWVTTKEKDSSISWRMTREVGLSSTTSARVPLRSRGIANSGRSGWRPTTKPAVKLKVLPTPGSLSTRISPPIMPTRRWQMVSPNPVPPYLRVVEVSAWEKDSNSRPYCSAVRPMPVSRTLKRISDGVGVLAEQLGGHHDFTDLGELDGVARQVDQDLPQPQRVADQGPRDPGVGPEEHLDPFFFLGLDGDQAGQVVQDLVEHERHRLHLQLAGLDLGKVEDVVDDPQQRSAGRPDLLQVALLLGGQLGLQGEVGHAEDGVHGGADLVAHVGQKVALGLGGGLGPVPGLDQSPPPSASARSRRGCSRTPPRGPRNITRTRVISHGRGSPAAVTCIHWNRWWPVAYASLR